MDFILGQLQNLKPILGEHPMFAAGLLLLTGYLIGKLAALLKLPEVTGYILAGLLVGESVTGIFPSAMNDSFIIITETALGLIALAIGVEFSASKLKRIGRATMVINLVQVFLTLAAVTLAMLLMGMDLPFALLLGAVATTTAPAASLAVAHSLRARGKFVDYIHSIIALGDAGCLLLFGLILSFIGKLLGATGGGGGDILHALREVGISLVLGLVGGFALHKITRDKKGPNELLILSLAIIFLTTATAIIFHLSPLLSNMTMGCVLVNLSARNHRLFRALEPLTPPLYALFFVIAGTELNLEVFYRRELALMGGVYILVRAAGKYCGAWLGCLASGIREPIRANLGWCMLPQAGVALGLVLLIQTSPVMQRLSESQVQVLNDMVNIVLMSVFVNELIGPPLLKMAIMRGNQNEDELEKHPA
ncbi:MAG: cation:proton antiporter [Verrucomicrobia bacterium]|nr:cation:proton antiporter [Verrucomicrobiota bacterium]